MTQFAPFVTNSAYPSPLSKSYLKRTLELARQSFDRGWHPGTGGNFSVRGSASLAWVSASGRHKGLMQLSDFLPIDIQTAKPGLGIYQKPSDETALHCAIYRFDGSARAVIHVHTPYTVAAARTELRLGENEMLKVFGLKTHEAEIVIPVIPNTQDMEALGQTVAKDLDASLKVLILEGHGVYAWGRDPDEAMYRIEALEYLCQTQKLCEPISSPSA